MAQLVDSATNSVAHFQFCQEGVQFKLDLPSSRECDHCLVMMDCNKFFCNHEVLITYTCPACGRGRRYGGSRHS